MKVCNFLRLVGYYWRFIESFSHIAAPMTKLTKKEKNFEWTDQCEQSFQKLKRRLTEEPILALPQEDVGFVVCIDASKNDLGCVLMQDGRVITYASR